MFNNMENYFYEDKKKSRIYKYIPQYIWRIHIQRKQKEITGNLSGTGMMEL